MRFSTVFAVLSAFPLLACSTPPAAPPAPIGTPKVTALVTHRDERIDVPSFSWLRTERPGRFQSPRSAAAASLEALAPSLRASKEALAAARVETIHDTGRGPIIVEYAQRVGDIDVFRAHLRIALNRSLEPIAASGLLAPSLSGADGGFPLDARTGVRHALAALGSSDVPVPLDQAGRGRRFGAPSLEQPALARQVYFPLPGDRLEPAWYVEAKLRRGGGRSFVISARDGRVLFENDQVRHEAARYRVFADPETLVPDHSPYGVAGLPHPTGVPDGYRPSYATPRMVEVDHLPFSMNDPWLASSTTDTSGNNVDAFADLVQPNGFTGSSADRRAAMTGTREFDYAYDPSLSPSANPSNINASVTQMFYLMNFLHDWFYDAGFDEKSGNPQTSNFGRGGIGNDAVRAEVQDYSGRNNANAYTPSDGSPPQIQMYIFSGTSTASLEITAPASIAGTKPVGLAGFGSADSFNLAGSVVLGIDDQGADGSDGCEPLTNNVTGKIVLLHRGVCSFAQKVLSGQNAGAIGVLISNVTGSSDPTIPPYMGGTGNDVSIPSLSLSLADGAAIEAALGAGVDVTMHRSLQTDLDGALDTNVASHEWGHVLSNRLIGDGNGLFTNQAGGLGEGWGDFVALLVASRPEQVDMADGAGWNGVYPSGSYAMAGSGSDYYFGIRRVPYSADRSKDPLTFAHISNGVPLPAGAQVSFGEDGSFNAEVHNVGEVWATMLWECYVGLLRDKRTTFAVAQDKMKRYLVASMKMTPIDPTLLEARDALLAAALATDDGDYRIFWRAFARRGAGVGATGPGRTSSDNRGAVESFAAGNDLQILEAKLADDKITCDKDGLLDEGERGTITVKLRNDGTGTVEAGTLIVSSATGGVLVDDDGFLTLPTLAPMEEATVSIGLRMQGAPEVEPLLLDVMLVDPSFAAPNLIKVSIPSRFHADEAPDASTIDRVDTSGTSWLAQGADGDTWHVVKEGNAAWWKVEDGNLVSDHELRSAPFTIEGQSFSVAWKHRHSFRRSQRRMVDIDGGVLEYSTDDGATWTDVGDAGQVEYNTTLDETRMNNALAGRRAFGNTTIDYPNTWLDTSATVNLPAHPERVMIRFRMATAGGGFASSPGWEIDDIALTGATSTPFWSYVEHRDGCDPAAPVANAGPGQEVRSGQVVLLSGSGGEHYHWVQESGPFAVLSGKEAQEAQFVAPEVDEATLLVFALRVDDGTLLSAPARVSITVTSGRGCAYTGGGARGGDLLLVLSVMLGVGIVRSVTRRRRRASTG